MKHLPQLFANNRAWARAQEAAHPDYFRELAKEQRPDFLWIGCSDSRVPANEIVGLQPGELFVHRNVGNVVVHSDLNSLSVLQFAVEVLGVGHVIVCGHYGCGAVAAAWGDKPLGLMDHWLRHIEDVADAHRERLTAIQDRAQILDRLCELNVVEQATHVCRTNTVQEAWRRGQKVTVHAWIYDLADGLLQDLGFSVDSPTDLAAAYSAAVQARATAGRRPGP